jgi:hypothetical protein
MGGEAIGRADDRHGRSRGRGNGGERAAGASYAWQKAAVVTAPVVAALVAYLWFSRPPAYVGKTDGALLNYDGCARVYVLSAQPEVSTVGPSPSQYSRSWAYGRPWVTPASDTPSELTAVPELWVK